MTRSGTHLSINSFLWPDTRAFLAWSSSRSCGRVHDSYPPLSLSNISKSFRPKVSLQHVKTCEKSHRTSTVRDVECTLPARQRFSWLARHLSTVCATVNPINTHLYISINIHAYISINTHLLVLTHMHPPVSVLTHTPISVFTQPNTVLQLRKKQARHKVFSHMVLGVQHQLLELCIAQLTNAGIQSGGILSQKLFKNYSIYFSLRGPPDPINLRLDLAMALWFRDQDQVCKGAAHIFVIKIFGSRHRGARGSLEKIRKAVVRMQAQQGGGGSHGFTTILLPTSLSCQSTGKVVVKMPDSGLT